MKYFANINNLDALKAAYRRLAMQNHPDKGGNPETMKAINNEYEATFERIKANVKAETGTETTETPADFVNIVNQLMQLDGLEIELCGRWLWIGGNTYAHKDALKAAGCRWCGKKKLWSWHYPEDSRVSKRNHSMTEIRAKFGSEIITGCKTSALPA